LNKYVKRNFTG